MVVVRLPQWPKKLVSSLYQGRFTGRVARAARRFAANTRGVAAVEFALVATPFFLTLFAMIEVSMIYLGSIALDNGTQQAARMVRTGQIQGGGGAQVFRDTVCGESFALLSCGADLYVDVRAYPSFATIDTAPPVDADGNPIPGQFNTGTAGDVVMVRTYYVWPVFTPGLSLFLGNVGSSGARLLISTTAFRNEPFNG